MAINERVARGVALEQAYVHDVYEQFLENPNSRPWPRVQQFLTELEPGSLVCDVGCGNGKYLNVNPSVFNIGGDASSRLCETAKEKDNEVIRLDNLALPFREESLDAVLSIAVIHHLATTDRRVRALRELARVLRIGGRIIISVWAMEQSNRKFESQDVLVPWHRPQQLSTPSFELTSTTNTSEDDGLPPYHAYTQSDSDSNRSNRSRNGARKRGRTRHKGRSIDPKPSSPSSSSLSSPNETCYSFVRRAFQKLAGGRRGVHRPWFLESWTVCAKESSSKGYDCCTCCECEDIQNLPIELRRVDEEEMPQRRQTFPSSQLISEIYSNFKSRSLTDMKSVENNNIVRSKSSIPSIEEAIIAEKKQEEANSNPKASKPKLVKQKKSVCEEDAEEALDEPTDMKDLVNALPECRVMYGGRRGNVLKQRSLNEELMSVERLREKERVKLNIQKQASLNDDLIYRRQRTFDSLKDSLFSVTSAKRFQSIKTGFTNKIKSSTTNIEKVTGSSFKNGFVRMFQNWKSTELTSPSAPDDDEPVLVTSPQVVTDDKNAVEVSGERRSSKEDGSDSSKDSSLQSDTSVDSEDSFASVIFVPKTDPTSPTNLSPGPTSPRLNSSSVPNSPRIKQSSCPTSPRIKQVPLVVHSLTKQLSSPKPCSSSSPAAPVAPTNAPPSPGAAAERDQRQPESTIEEDPKSSPTSTSMAQKYSVPQIPLFRRSAHSNAPDRSNQPLDLTDTSRSDRLKSIRELLSKKPGFGVRAARSSSNYPIVRRSSMSTGNFENLAKPLPKLLSLELFNPETDDKDSDSSAVSSPDSIDSIIEKKTRTAQSKFRFPAVKCRTSPSKGPLEAAADVANPLEDKTIKSSPRTKRRQLQSDDVISAIQRPYDTDCVPLLHNEEEEKTVWDEECHRHLRDFAGQLGAKLLSEIDQYQKENKEPTLDHIDDPYINRLSEELYDLSKLSKEIQKQNEYLANLSASDHLICKKACEQCKLDVCGCDQPEKKTVKRNKSLDSPDTRNPLPSVNRVKEPSVEDVTKSLPKLDAKMPDVADGRTRTPVQKGTSLDSCSSEKGSSSNSVTSSMTTSIQFRLSIESADGVSERGSSDSHKDISSMSKCSNGGSTASLISCSEWTNPRTKSLREEKLELEQQPLKDKGLIPSLSDTSQESLPSDNVGGAITYHRYYHVFREGELDQLIEKYVQNLHIISSYYDHASWCVVAEKVHVWTI